MERRKQCSYCGNWFDQDERLLINCPAHSWGETEILERCGDCGAWQDDPELYSEEAREHPNLVHCGCKNPNEEINTYDL